MILLLLLFVLISVIYITLKWNNNYWSKLGVPGPKPTLLVGNVGKNITMQKSLGEIYANLYNQYPDEPFVGAYKGTTPVLILRDPDIIKNVLVKEFAHFTDNDFHIDQTLDPLFSRNPFVLHGHQWKIVRNQLTPCFSSGKIKALFPLVEKNCQRLIRYIKDQQEGTLNNDCLESKEVCAKFALNNVAICAFGLEANSFDDPNSQFNELAKEFATPGGLASIQQLIVLLLPTLSKLLSIRFTSKEANNMFIDIALQTLRYREENHITRNDFFDLVNQLKNTSKEYEFTNIDVAAHAAGFFLDGYETSSMAMSFILFELAENIEAQSVLRAEIVNQVNQNHGVLTYETLQEMHYLDAVISESLRLHPVLLQFVRMCTTKHTFKTASKSDLTIESGTPIIIPVHGLHRDPKYFQNPDAFIPQRFMGENKEKITKYTYFPFGEGPRICLGKRFAILQLKLGIANIVRNFHLTTNSKTMKPLRLDPTYFLIAPIGGLWLNFEPILTE